MTKNTAKNRDDVFNRVKSVFSDPEIIELTLICGMFNMINRLNDTLGLEIESQPEVDKIKESLYIDPKKIKTYLHWLADNWPDEFDDLNRRASEAAETT